jgi:hypothetical protein
MTMGFDDFGKARVFRQEAIAGMDRLGAGDFGGRNDGGDVQIGAAGRRRSDAHAFIGQLDMHGVGVGFGVHRDGADAHLLAGPVDP